MKAALSESLLAALAAVMVCATNTHAQQAATKPWLFGFQLGQAGLVADAFDENAWMVPDNGASFRGEPESGEHAITAYVGKFVTKHMHFDAVIAGRVDGTFGGGGEGGGIFPFLPHAYREYYYQGASRGEVFTTTYARLVFEGANEQSRIRPRALLAGGIILKKWAPAALAGGGLAIGSQKTRFTVDVGAQFYRVAYELRERHYIGDQITEENITTGVQKPSGYFVHLGVQHMLHQ